MSGILAVNELRLTWNHVHALWRWELQLLGYVFGCFQHLR